jgi:hypothetical protein
MVEEEACANKWWNMFFPIPTDTGNYALVKRKYWTCHILSQDSLLHYRTTYLIKSKGPQFGSKLDKVGSTLKCQDNN